MSTETLPSLLQHARQSLQRDGDLAATQKVKKALRFGASRALAPLYLLGADSVGPGARTRGRPLIRNAGRMSIGARAHIGSMFAKTELRTGPGGELSFGDDVTINFGCSISADRAVSLGDRVSLGPYVTISDSDGEAGDESGPANVTIGNDVWLAARVRVRKGATIGDGAVITAGSDVRGEIPPGVVAGGSPARVLRKLTEPESKKEEETLRSAQEKAPLPVDKAASPVEDKAHPEVRGMLVADFSIQELSLHLASHDPLGPRVTAVVAPFGQVVQTLHNMEDLVQSEKLGFAVVWTRPESIVSFKDRLLGKEVRPEDVLAEVDAYAERIVAAAGKIKHLFVPTWVLPSYERGLGMIDMREGGIAHTLLRMNMRLAEGLRRASNVFVLDASRWVHGAKAAMSGKLWLLGKVSFSAEVLAEAASDIRAGLRGVSGAAKKLVVVDLDDTLWGGILGDRGWENLQLGGHDPVGEAFVELQHRLKALLGRGVLLAVVSKNEESVALEAIAKHPAMVLKADDLAAYRINWRDKAANIADLVHELNLGLQSVVFIDDNPVERARVREALPEVFVPDWPEDKLLYPEALLSLRCFDTPVISKEDIERTKMYAAERGREALKKEVGSIDDWLIGLGMKVSFARLDASNLARTTQLLNKTNQMNLSTRRLGEKELSAWAAEPGHELWTVSVSDRLGDSGLTGILGLQTDGDALQILDYILSCRVMGRRVEELMLWLAAERAKALGKSSVYAQYLKTPKNKPCLTLLQGSGFALDEPTMVFRWLVKDEYKKPAGIEVIGLAKAEGGAVS